MPNKCQFTNYFCPLISEASRPYRFTR